jgi:hypothetical protein
MCIATYKEWAPDGTELATHRIIVKYSVGYMILKIKEALGGYVTTLCRGRYPALRDKPRIASYHCRQ